MIKSNIITLKYTLELQEKYSSKFDCGNWNINSFIKERISLDSFFGTTYVLIANDELIGFYNISTGYIEQEKDEIYERQGGAIYINYLAIDVKYQKFKYNEDWYMSDLLLNDCISRCISIQDNIIGFSFITLSSTKEGYYLYERNGFSQLDDDMYFAKNSGEQYCTSMFLAMDFEE